MLSLLCHMPSCQMQNTWLWPQKSQSSTSDQESNGEEENIVSAVLGSSWKGLQQSAPSKIVSGMNRIGLWKIIYYNELSLMLQHNKHVCLCSMLFYHYPILASCEVYYASVWGNYAFVPKSTYYAQNYASRIRKWLGGGAENPEKFSIHNCSWICALTPVITAECERAFSSMKRIKTSLRNRLKTPTLDCLMRISIEGPPSTDFNFDKAADIWGGMRNRRLCVGSSSSS